MRFSQLTEGPTFVYQLGNTFVALRHTKKRPNLTPTQAEPKIEARPVLPIGKER